MVDEIMKELWQTKDSIADEYDYDAKVLVAHLRAKKVQENRRLVDLRSEKRTTAKECSR